MFIYTYYVHYYDNNYICFALYEDSISYYCCYLMSPVG